MRLRNRILLASVLLIAAPLLVLTFGIRREMEHRLTAQYTARITTLMEIIEAGLVERRHRLGKQLATLRGTIPDDNRFRLAAVEGQADQRSYLLDYAGVAMNLMGLDMLQIQDVRGQIISSGHFRNEFGREESLLPLLLSTVPDGTALVTARRPDRTFLAMARVDSVRLGGRLLHLVGGHRVDAAYLAELSAEPALGVSLIGSGVAVSSDSSLLATFPAAQDDTLRPPPLPSEDYLMRGLALPLVTTTGPRVDLGTATLLVTYPLAPLRDLLRSLNLWLALVFLATLAGTLTLAIWASGRISRPLDDLARKTAELDLDQLDADFPTSRTDEVGTLSRFLADMTSRLQASVLRLREAERRATLGELARQINHDIRNGLTPLRNVFRHLIEVTDEKPAETARILRERRDTLESGLTYLEELAGNYAKLSPVQTRLACDLNLIVREAMAGQPPKGSPGWIELDLEPGLPPILADPVGLRRILENLVRNARESLADKAPQAGWVGVRTRLATTGDSVPSPGSDSGPASGSRAGTLLASAATADPAQDSREQPETPTGRRVHLIVADNGCGIPPEDRDRIFQDFYSSKPDGSGLGLSNVRRLVADFEGSIALASEPGRGTVFKVTFPAVEDSTAGDAEPQEHTS